MEVSSILLARQVVKACRQRNISRIVISPGSRNAPLTMSFYSDAFFKCYSIVDERCAGFFALGMAQQLREPVAVVCTSGSAVLNYYPAFSEAYYSNIPLVVISADRPESKIDIGDGQTIRQQGIFALHSYYNANLTCDDHQFSMNDYLIHSALKSAVENSGPVHINVPFEEPLYQMQSYSDSSTEKITDAPKVYEFSNQDLFLQRWKSSSKRMALVGSLFPDTLSKASIKALLDDKSVLVLTETLSNIHHPNAITSIDKFLTSVESGAYSNEDLRPDVLLTFGPMVVSKKIKQFLRKNPPKYHYHIDLHKGYDTYFCLTEHIQCPVDKVLESLPFVENGKEYVLYWQNVYQNIEQKHQQFVGQLPFSDMYVFYKIFTSLPHDIDIQLSNSSTVRYAQLFRMNTSWRSFCNRGTSGIDGSTSTAIGASVVSQLPVVLLTGDLSFFYDSNALWNAYTPSRFRIILINNNGGGIFRILPGYRSDEHFQRFFETPHNLTAKHLCEMYGWGYSTARTKSELSEVLDDFFTEKNAPQLLEVFTPRDLNDKVLQQYFSYLKTN